MNPRLIVIASAPAASQRYEHALELAMALNDASLEVVVFIDGEAREALLALASDPESVFVRKLSQLELMGIPCVMAGTGLQVSPLAFINLEDENALRALLCSAVKTVVF